MPTTHPQYRLVYHMLGDDIDAAYAHGGLLSLSEAIALAADWNARNCEFGFGDDSHYSIEPVPGTEPRYVLRCSGPNGRGDVHSAYHGLGTALSWSAARAAFDKAAADEAANTCAYWPMTYRVVQA